MRCWCIRTQKMMVIGGDLPDEFYARIQAAQALGS